MIENDDMPEKISLNETLPHQINAPSFLGTGIRMESSFVNSFGVTIGDSQYASSNSPLENWSDQVNPEIMSSKEWVHPTNDIGWNTVENRELLESKRKKPLASPFMHPDKDAGSRTD